MSCHHCEVRSKSSTSLSLRCQGSPLPRRSSLGLVGRESWHGVLDDIHTVTLLEHVHSADSPNSTIQQILQTRPFSGFPKLDQSADFLNSTNQQIPQTRPFGRFPKLEFANHDSIINSYRRKQSKFECPSEQVREASWRSCSSWWGGGGTRDAACARATPAPKFFMDQNFMRITKMYSVVKTNQTLNIYIYIYI